MSYNEREYRYSRHRDNPYSDDEKYQTTTVRRYKVGGRGGGGSTTRIERVERFDEDDDRRSRHSFRDDYRDSHSHVGRTSGDVLEVDRRVERSYLPERPRSAFDDPAQRTVVEKRFVERDGSHYRDYDRKREDRYRVTERDVEYVPERRERDQVIEREREVEYSREREPERGDRIVKESRETIERGSPLSPRDRDWDWRSGAPWDDRDDVRVENRIERHGDHLDDVRVEKRVERRSDDHVDEVRVDKRVEREHHDHHDHDGEIERYRKETEYYAPADPPPQPIVIRQKAPEPQQIIVQEAPAPPPVIVDRRQPDPGYIVLRENNREIARRDPREEEYYHRREERRHRDDDYAIERYHRRRREYPSDEEDVYVKRTVIRRERSDSSDHHKKRHLAEGALAGAGLSALVASRRDREGDVPENRGKKVLAGAALGALGTEVLRRAKSAYEDRYDDEEEYYDHRHRHRSRSRSRLTTGLAIGAAALAVAGGLKYMQTNKIEKEEATRGRSRGRRYSADDYSHSRSHSRSRSRRRSKSNSNVAKAAAATGAIAGLVQHYRSKSRGHSRSKSRLRTGAEIAAASLTGAAATKLYERQKSKKERKHDKEVDDDYYSDRDHHRSSSSRSRSRSRSARSFSTREDPADRELGLVEYGFSPAYEPVDERPHRARPPHRSASVDSERETSRKRSKSRLRDAAAGVLGAGAAAIGIKKYNDSKKGKERESPRETSMQRSPHEKANEGKRERRKRERRSRERERRRYEEEAGAAGHYPDGYDPEAPPSPPTASGGAFYPGQQGPTGFTQHPYQSTMNVNAYPPVHPYNPADFVPPPPGPPPARGRSQPPYPPNSPESVSRESSLVDNEIHSHHNDPDTGGDIAQDGVRRRRRRHRDPSPIPQPPLSVSSATESPPPTSKSVAFIPLSPQSSFTLKKLHQAHDDKERSEAEKREANGLDERGPPAERSVFHRKRSDLDPSSDRPLVPRRRRRRDDESTQSGEEIEVLPDRFDAHGRPIDPNERLQRWTSRQGDFEYRPRNRHSTHVQGHWGVASTDPEMVERMAQGVGSILDGRKGWMEMLGGILANRLSGLGGAGRESIENGRIDDVHENNDDEDYDDRRRRKYRRKS